jgi:hypothetical protein
MESRFLSPWRGIHVEEGIDERICDTTYPISSSPYYGEDIHTKITHVITQRSHDPRII